MSTINSKLREAFREIGDEATIQNSIRKVVLKFYEKMSTDIMLGFFFTGKDLDRIAYQQAHFLLRAAGISSTYQGKTPAKAHSAIPPILQGHFDRRLVILKEVLEEAGFNENIVTAWVSFENSFRKSIVEAEAPISKRKK